MKHTFALLNAVLISMALWALLSPASAITPWNGTSKVPSINGLTYSVSTPEELAWVAEQSRSNDFAGYTVRLEADLDLGGTQELPPSWEPIGTATYPFRGELDGNNHVVYNLYILNSFTDGAGLVAQTGAEAIVHNLGLAQGQIMTDMTDNVGGIVGIHRGRLHHCFSMTQIIAHNGDNVGGLVGTNYGTIEFSYNCGIITDANNHVGGLAGVNKSTAVLRECYNSGYCKGSDHAGALFGSNEAPAASITLVYFDQQVTRTYATGYGTADALDNNSYAIEKTTTFLSGNSPFAGHTEWSIVRGSDYCYPRLTCFADHEAALISTNAILLDAQNLPLERAEGVGAPMEGNHPRKQFGLSSPNTSTWFSPSEDVIRIAGDHAEVVRPCGNQEVILTVSEGATVKQIYTIVKGYEKFDAGRMEGSYTACWREEETFLRYANRDGKAPLGGKDDEQDGDYCYRYLLIRDTVVVDEHRNPVSCTPMDTFYLSHRAYEGWVMPTSVPGTYAFRRYVHDYQCTTDWTESPGRSYLTVLNAFDAGSLYEKPDTVRGVPRTLVIESEQDATGGSGEYSYLWKVEYSIWDSTAHEWKPQPSQTKNPLYVDGVLADSSVCVFPCEAAGRYTFTRRVSDAQCSTTPLTSLNEHVVIVNKLPEACRDTDVLVIPVCQSALPYSDIYHCHDGRIVPYTFATDGEQILVHDTTRQGCAWEITLQCKVVPMPEVEVQPVVAVCETDTMLRIEYTVNEGDPDTYDLYFMDEARRVGFTDMAGALLPDSDAIELPMPEHLPVGSYTFIIVFYTAKGGTADCKDRYQTYSFGVDIAGFVHRKWNDVLFVDNNAGNGHPDREHDMRFTAWQWYRNGSPVSGATEQFYYEPSGLNGNYQVQMTADDGTVYRSCIESILQTGDNQQPEAKTRKELRNGQLLLIVGGRAYTVFGQMKGGAL
ncbi:MAG: hypothetical protein IJT12_04420 [Paludibacteraceae bacterium]|nr:hypothetical protein [Paludibacteraceae bacterium]